MLTAVRVAQKASDFKMAETDFKMMGILGSSFYFYDLSFLSDPTTPFFFWSLIFVFQLTSTASSPDVASQVLGYRSASQHPARFSFNRTLYFLRLKNVS